MSNWLYFLTLKVDPWRDILDLYTTFIFYVLKCIVWPYIHRLKCWAKCERLTAGILVSYRCQWIFPDDHLSLFSAQSAWLLRHTSGFCVCGIQYMVLSMVLEKKIILRIIVEKSFYVKLPSFFYTQSTFQSGFNKTSFQALDSPPLVNGPDYQYLSEVLSSVLHSRLKTKGDVAFLMEQHSSWGLTPLQVALVIWL